MKTYALYDKSTNEVTQVISSPTLEPIIDMIGEAYGYVEANATPGRCVFDPVSNTVRDKTPAEIEVDATKLRRFFKRLEETPATVTYNGNDYQFSLATTDLYRMRLLADNWASVAPLLAGNKLPWVLADDTMVELTQGQFMQIVGILENRKAKRLARLMLKYQEAITNGTPTMEHVQQAESTLDD